MKKHQNHRYFTAVCIASAIFAVLLCLALFLIVTGDRSELERVEAQAAVFLEQMEQAADSARQSAIAGAQDNFGNSMPGCQMLRQAYSLARRTLPPANPRMKPMFRLRTMSIMKKSRMRFAMTSLTAWSGRSVI